MPSLSNKREEDELDVYIILNPAREQEVNTAIVRIQGLAVNWIYKAGVYTRLCDNIYSDIMSLLGYFDASDRFFGKCWHILFAYIFLSLVNQN